MSRNLPRDRELVPSPIGVFDSGVGGLSVLQVIHSTLPHESLSYVADQAHVPYGVRSLSEVRAFSEGITRFLLNHSAKLIVVACNTASAAALHHLRAAFPQVRFVGMEPAVKPAAATTRSKVVGVLGTPATFQGELFASVVDRFAGDVEVIPVTLPGLVEEIESGDLSSPRLVRILKPPLEELQQRQVDTLVLACTHFPFVLGHIRSIMGPGVEVIDPSPAIARQVERVLQREGWKNPPDLEKPPVTYYTTGSMQRFQSALDRLSLPGGHIFSLRWSGMELEGAR